MKFYWFGFATGGMVFGGLRAALHSDWSDAIMAGSGAVAITFLMMIMTRPPAP